MYQCCLPGKGALAAQRGAGRPHPACAFAAPNFAEKNTPVSFLTVHMADVLMKIVNLIPVQARAAGYSQNLPSLKPIPVNGYDLVDTEILFATSAKSPAGVTLGPAIDLRQLAARQLGARAAKAYQLAS